MPDDLDRESAIKTAGLDVSPFGNPRKPYPGFEEDRRLLLACGECERVNEECECER